MPSDNILSSLGRGSLELVYVVARVAEVRQGTCIFNIDTDVCNEEIGTYQEADPVEDHPWGSEGLDLSRRTQTKAMTFSPSFFDQSCARS